MLSEDRLIRMINLAIAALLQVIGLRKSGNYIDALQLIDLTLEQLLGLRASMAKSLDDDRLYYLLTRNDQLDTRRLVVVAGLLAEEGEIYAAQGRTAESTEDFTRALRYSLEVQFQSPNLDAVDVVQQIEYLVQKLDIPNLGADTLWPLAGYYEERGAYAKADNILRLLASRPDTREQILPELTAFYQRLLEKPPASLEAGGLTLAQVKARLGIE